MEVGNRQDIALDAFIDCGYYSPQILNDAIESITPDILAQWIDTGQFSPRPNCGHSIVFTVGFILVRGIDSKLHPENPEKMQQELEYLKDNGRMPYHNRTKRKAWNYNIG